MATILIIAALGVGWYVYASATAPKPDFTIGAPTGVTIHAGIPTTSTVSVTYVNQFSGTILLTTKGSPGLNATISPSSLTDSGLVTLTTSSITNGSYTVTVTGTSGSVTHSATPTVATPVFATFATSKGTIEIELYRAQTPRTFANFENLAQSNFYKNLVWHRIHPGFVIQTGDPNTRNAPAGTNNTWGQGHSQQTVPLEIDSSLHNSVGYLGMARFGNDLNSGSSQFYINLADNSASLDGKYTVFGKVIGGLDVANAISNVPIYSPPDGQPITPVFLTSVTIH